MAWRLRIWCGDCGHGQDPMGCFEGGETVSDETFESKEAAESYGLAEWHGPYEWEAFEEPGDRPSTPESGSRAT